MSPRWKRAPQAEVSAVMAFATHSRPLFRLARSYAAQAMDGAWLSCKNYIWLLVTLAVGFFVRVNELGAQSLWNDEGTSVALAQRSISAIVNAAARDIHPPLYYLLLSAWIPFSGIGEFAVRFLSVLAGVLVIALTFRIAREFFDQDVALLAAVLSALNPFQTYYAQETRMYIWVTLFVCLSVWALIKMFNPPRERTSSATRGIRRRTAFWFLYIFATLAALYTNYYAFTLLLVENLAFVAWLLWAWRARRTGIGHSFLFWFAAQILIVLAYVPWLNFARQSLTSWPGISEPLTLWDMAWRIVSAFALGFDQVQVVQVVFVAAYILFFVGGLLPSRDLFTQSVWGIVVCALWAVVPLLAMYFLSLARPAYNPKFLLLATPGFLICVARGVSVLYPGLFLRERAPYATIHDPLKTRLTRQWVNTAKMLVGGLFAAGLVLALQNLYGDPHLQRDDYRGIVNYINAVATERDAVLVNAPGQMDVVRYYYHSPAQLVGLPIGRPIQREATQTALNELSARENLYGIFWATEQADPENLIERVLAQTTYKARDEWHGNVRLTEYARARASRTVQSGVSFGDEILLRRYLLDAKPLAGGDILPFELVWMAQKSPLPNYKIFAHLLDANGRIVAQRDSEPQNGFAPTSQWKTGVEVSDKVGLLIPPGTPPGAYSLVIGVYRGDSGERLTRRDGSDTLILDAITIGKRILPRAAVFAQSIPAAVFREVALLGYQVERIEFARGEFIPLVLYFQAWTKPTADAQMEVQLRDQGDNVIASARAFENYPTTRWDAEEIVRDVQTLNIPLNALLGEYKIVVTDGAQTFEVTRVQVR